MKRDINLIRLLLLELEGQEVTLEQYTNEQILYHKDLLIGANLARGKSLVGGDKLQSVMLTGLTSEGHDFLDATRNDKIWNKIVKRLGKTGGDVSIAVLKSVVGTVVKESFGIN